MEIAALILFLLIFLLILSGFPVAFVLGGLSTIFGFIFLGPEFFLLLPSRFMGVMGNYVLLAVPLFIFMGVMFEKSGLAEKLLINMGRLFGGVGGGLAVSTIIVGTLLAASTGIVGATVITMGLISLPVMLKKKYSPSLATGTIAASGTLGQIIPPSIVLVLLGSVLNVSVGDLFAAAVIPGLLLVTGYVVYVLLISKLRPKLAPVLESTEELGWSPQRRKEVFVSFLMPLFLIVAVLGSIFAGIASPTEAAAIGALGATILTLFQGNLTLDVVRKVARETTHITTMVFFILLGATTFALVFRGLGGDRYLVDIIQQSELSGMAFLLLVMLVVFVSGFFIDFIEIIFIIVPVVAPIFQQYDIDLIWIGILLALNLQSSFLTPPFGFALFYLKGVSPPGVKTAHLYRGIVPFLIIQVLILGLVLFWPQVVYVFI